jgi:transcriptional regulator with AAA-type ATPase domain/NAD-dependent dihydropyrimidine dehydrogenase PreA subunit
MTLASLVTWLQERTSLSSLSEEAIAAIAPMLEERTLASHQRLVESGTVPDGLYILRSGHLESENKINQALEVGLLPGSVINLQELILKQSVRDTIVALDECHLWFISAENFQELINSYPEIPQTFSQKLAQEVEQLSSQLTFERESQTILRPYLVSKAKRGIIGKSRYATRLRSQIQQASESRDSVLIFGEPGLEKDNIAALIHFSSSYRKEPIIKVNCSQLQASGADLFGRLGGKMGLLEALGEGTLILNNIQELPSELIKPVADLLRTNTYTPVVRFGENSGNSKTSQARIIIISENPNTAIDCLVKVQIKVPPLRVRKTDLEDLSKYYISLFCRAKGVKKSFVTQEALRRLQAYDFPNNLRELENLIERALVQLQGCAEITEEVIWPSQGKKKQFRLNLLNAYPRLRQFLRSNWWPDRINYGFTLVAFALINIILFVGPQTRSQNFALNLFWAWWWPLVLIGFPFVGRVWCAVCPFMIYGEVTQKISLWLFPRELKKWPRQEAEKWGGWFLFGLFALILLWEELWNLENTAYLSSCLLLLITSGAVICSALFERRFWCRYLCPIGGMNGLFAKLSMTELRAQQGICSAECTTYQCYKGGPHKGEGMETDGCPLYSHPAQLEDNRDCVLCMTCLKACPHRSVEFNLRPPGIELWTTHVPHGYEVALLFLLLDTVFLHHLYEIQTWLGLSFNLSLFGIHFLVAIAALTLPALIPLAGYGIMQLVYRIDNKIKPRRFIELAYGYLPLVLAGNLAHYLQLWLAEAGRILPVSLATFGFSNEGLPILVAHPAVIVFLQGTTLILGVILSIVLTQKIARQSFKLLSIQHLCTVLLAIGMWKVVVGN